MDPELKSKMEEVLQMTEENNKIIKTLRRTIRIGQVIRGVYWLIIIGIAVSAYYFAQPYVEGVKDTYSGAQNDISNLNSILRNFGGGGN
ncbi:MAG TPA: hypothetical protein VFQ59_02960 [Candidatus Paceibacterota bacterium]|nr:hypothetical protein [Candidatus Paceibacterota bacterium]